MTHYFSKKQDSKFVLKTIRAILRNQEFSFHTAPGVFSKDDIDNGTKLLINKSIIAEKGKILDLGCGYGAVGISLGKMFPELTVVMSDVNKRAIKLAKMNSEANKLKNITIIESDGFEKIEGLFDTILLNPPFHAGMKICKELINRSFEHLKKGGTLQVVARHQKGGKTIQKHMNEVFDNCEDIAKKGGFRIYLSKRDK
jgi:16S rRNA G1207 methylase RsmC